jgi:hypothetical protein
MRSTVGPLPAAVYWRRRLTVLAALLVLVLGVVFACSGSDSGQRARGAGSVSQLPASDSPPTAVLTPETPEPSFEETGPPEQGPADPPPDAPTSDPAVSADPDGACTDEEMLITPAPARTSARRGQPIDLRLRIRNVSTRTCARDVGADLQEIYIKQGARKVWSSDACGLARGSDVQQFRPNFEREYRVTWNGRSSSRCHNGSATGPLPAAGDYQVLGRLGAKVSEPVRLSIAA